MSNPSQIADLDFIVDDEFRRSLSEDLRELDSAIANGSIKSAHVLAGSIVEAVLIDRLISDEILNRDVALKLDLHGAIEKCRENGIIRGQTADLSSVVKSYRNLIHPGRAIRVKERIDINSAQVAKSLVFIVLSEIAERQRASGL